MKLRRIDVKKIIVASITAVIVLSAMAVMHFIGPRDITKGAEMQDWKLSYRGETYIYAGSAKHEDRGKLIKRGLVHTFYTAENKPDYIIETQMHEAYLYKRLGCDVEYDGETIKYAGKEYHVYDLFGEAYEYEKGMLIYKEEQFGLTDSIYTIKNDENCDFLVVEAFRDTTIYTSLDIEENYSELPENQKNVILKLGDEEQTVYDSEDIEMIYSLYNYQNNSNIKQIEYNPDECTIIEAKFIHNTPIFEKYFNDILIYNGTQWLIFGGIYEISGVENENHEWKYYGYPLDDIKIRNAFIEIMHKYYNGLFIDTFDYSYYDPMAYIAD